MGHVTGLTVRVIFRPGTEWDRVPRGQHGSEAERK